MNILLTSSTMFLSVVTIPYVTRTLSVEGYGNVNFAQSIWPSLFGVGKSGQAVTVLRSSLPQVR